jgi:hypothetical protein
MVPYHQLPVFYCPKLTKETLKMAEEQVDTQEAPADSAEQAEPTEVTESTEETTEEVTEPAYITAEQMQAALEKQDASFRSWLGRRDKETLSHIGNVINERLATQQPSESADEMSTRLLENPRATLRTEFEAYEAERTQKQANHINKAVEVIGMTMESDSLYADKDLGNEVVSEIKHMVQMGKVNHNMTPEAAGKVMLADALANVVRKRQGAKTNPLNQNKPDGGGGNLKPPATPAKKVKVPQLDAETKKMAEKWGYTDEQLAGLYGEKST